MCNMLIFLPCLKHWKTGHAYVDTSITGDFPDCRCQGTTRSYAIASIVMGLLTFVLILLCSLSL